MWSKHDKDNLYTMDGDESFTFLGKGAQFKGIIHFEGTIRIDGRLEGEIHTKGTLMVGEHAVIEGDINADIVVCGGQISGNIVAAEKVQLLSTGVVTGTIKTPLLSVEEGVRLHGMCDAEGRGEVRALDGAREAAQQQQLTGVARVRGAWNGLLDSMFGSTSKHKELAMAGEETFTFLARGFEFQGTLTFGGQARI